MLRVFCLACDLRKKARKHPSLVRMKALLNYFKSPRVSCRGNETEIHSSSDIWDHLRVQLYSQDRVIICRKEEKKTKSRENRKIWTQLKLDLETVDRLNDMVMNVQEQWITPSEFKINRYNTICWRVTERRSKNTIVAIVLQDLNDGNFVFSVGGDWPHRPTTKYTSRDSLIEILVRIFPP